MANSSVPVSVPVSVAIPRSTHSPSPSRWRCITRYLRLAPVTMVPRKTNDTLSESVSVMHA